MKLAFCTKKILKELKVKMLRQIIVLFIVILAIELNAKPLDYEDMVTADDKLLLKMVDYLSGFAIGDDEDVKQTVTQVDAGNQRDTCLMPKRKGNCRALLQRWRYNSDTKDCEEFNFGGCDGNANNFMSYKQCMTVCKGV